MEPLELVYTEEDENKEVISPTKTNETALSVHGEEQEEDGKDQVDNDDIQPVSFCTRIKNYAFGHDGKELLACCIAGGLFFGLGYLVDEPVERPIPFQYIEETNTYILNQSLNNTFDTDSVPDWAVGLMAVIIGPGLQMVTSLVMERGFNRDMHRILCTTILALTVNDLSTWVLKCYAGYMRPSFYQLCQPDETYEECTNDEGYARDSFPSGHASFAFLSMTMLYLYWERCFGVSSVERVFVIMAPATPQSSTNSNNEMTKQPIGLEYSRPPMLYRFASMLCAGIPLAVASFVAVSRVADNRHHPADIIAGGILGSVIGYFFHTAWFQDRRFSLDLDNNNTDRGY